MRLVSKGHDVQLIDNREKLGGRAYRYEVNGFKFDAGPTVITAPYIFDEIFEAAGKKKEDYINLVASGRISTVPDRPDQKNNQIRSDWRRTDGTSPL